MSIKSFDIKLDANTYPIEVISLSSSKFLDMAHFDFKKKGKDEILVKVFPDKSDFNKSKFIKDFYKELTHNLARKKISEDNKNLREAIVFRALFSAIGGQDKELAKTAEKIREKEKAKKYLEDPLGIAVPWEEKYGKKRKKSRSSKRK